MHPTMNADRMAMLFTIFMASLFFYSIERGAMHPTDARRMFKMMNVFVVCTLATTPVQWLELGHFLLAAFGVQLLSVALRLLGEPRTVDAQKRTQ